jgi:3-oxoacyl-[acyl-carrier-protein] synthase I
VSNFPVFLNAVGLLCAAGNNAESLKQGLQSSHDFMTTSETYGDGQLPLGLCHDDLPSIPLAHPKWQSRNNQFALHAYQQISDQVTQAIKQYGADRVGVVIGTSTSGIADAEQAIKESVIKGKLPKHYNYSIQEMGNTAHFIAEISGATGPSYGISTACSSGAKALISAKRLITAGLCDAVIAGGVDTLCQLTVQGFSALEAISHQTCQPFSRNRDGINIGEAAALFVVSRTAQGVVLRGAGESSDAHHISAPEPNGKGAEQCMSMALQDAKLKPEDIDYINLHGTATQLNDQMEARAVHRLFGDKVLCSSTKPFTGHTLGAAGALEAAIAWITLTDKNGFIPIQRADAEYDSSIPLLNLARTTRPSHKIQYVLSNSFAFGGNNVALILERV